MRLVVTRPAADAERTAVALRLRGHAVTVAPVLRVESLPGAPISDGPWAAILVTSANAAPAVAAHARFAELRALPVLAVGERSAQAMREAGFADVSSSDGTAGDLVRLAAARPGLGLPLLYLAGEDRSRDIAADLGVQNIPVRTVVVYRAVAAEVLPLPAEEALVAGIDGVLHYSRRSAGAWLKLTDNAAWRERALNGPIHFCLSARVAEPLVQARLPDVRVAAQPTEAALFAKIPAT